MKPVLLVILQCPWRKGRLENGWNPGVWYKMLWISRTGVRLREALPFDFYEVRVCNANPSLADSPDGVFPPDLKHLRRALKRVQPDVILACGRVAQEAVGKIKTIVPVVEMKHPAYRLLSHRMTEEVRLRLEQLAVEMT